ncbi:hypothetical protein EXIGLDRAFT_830469 [Exidia glandulosa HHB12029]|uniref:Uncharacterized protein n=1 Tax=Exidia glandulosa HHB12029 TaxID=1314781 RepID=A0A165NJ78_EXIGL|nr:hypothetical protein EXIGLDRAFT_830469 [Exidia glandulosa HHB12029]
MTAQDLALPPPTQFTVFDFNHLQRPPAAQMTTPQPLPSHKNCPSIQTFAHSGAQPIGLWPSQPPSSTTQPFPSESSPSPAYPAAQNTRPLMPAVGNAQHGGHIFPPGRRAIQQRLTDALAAGADLANAFAPVPASTQYGSNSASPSSTAPSHFPINSVALPALFDEVPSAGTHSSSAWTHATPGAWSSRPSAHTQPQPQPSGQEQYPAPPAPYHAAHLGYSQPSIPHPLAGYDGGQNSSANAMTPVSDGYGNSYQHAIQSNNNVDGMRSMQNPTASFGRFGQHVQPNNISISLAQFQQDPGEGQLAPQHGAPPPVQQGMPSARMPSPQGILAPRMETYGAHMPPGMQWPSAAPQPGESSDRARIAGFAPMTSLGVGFTRVQRLPKQVDGADTHGESEAPASSLFGPSRTLARRQRGGQGRSAPYPSALARQAVAVEGSSSPSHSPSSMNTADVVDPKAGTSARRTWLNVHRKEKKKLVNDYINKFFGNRTYPVRCEIEGCNARQAFNSRTEFFNHIGRCGGGVCNLCGKEGPFEGRHHEAGLHRRGAKGDECEVMVDCNGERNVIGFYAWLQKFRTPEQLEEAVFDPQLGSRRNHLGPHVRKVHMLAVAGDVDVLAAIGIARSYLDAHVPHPPLVRRPPPFEPRYAVGTILKGEKLVRRPS